MAHSIDEIRRRDARRVVRCATHTWPMAFESSNARYRWLISQHFCVLPHGNRLRRPIVTDSVFRFTTKCSIELPQMICMSVRSSRFWCGRGVAYRWLVSLQFHRSTSAIVLAIVQLAMATLHLGCIKRTRKLIAVVSENCIKMWPFQMHTLRHHLFTIGALQWIRLASDMQCIQYEPTPIRLTRSFE